MGNRAVKATLDKLERDRAAAVAATLAQQWEVALKLWCEEFDFWSNFHRKSLILGNAKQSEEVFVDTVYERISRVLPLRVRKEKVDLRSAVEVVSDSGGE